MIKAVYGLEFDFDLVGVRVFMKDNSIYDVDIDVIKKQLRLNPKNLPALQLLEYGDSYMTEEEMFSGQLVEDASDDKAVLAQLKTYLGVREKDSPEYKKALREKVVKYRKEYYNYLPYNLLGDFAKYHFDNFEGNHGIYDEYNARQIKQIREYFKMRSRLVFEESRVSPILVAKPKKVEKLLALMGNAVDWEYNGTVDMGYRGASHCTLGHALRYEHYAYSKSRNEHIIFGQTCMSDFFEVDESVLRKIVEAQEMLLKEVKIITFVYRTGLLDDYKKQYEDFDKVYAWGMANVGWLGRNAETWLTFMADFIKNGLPLTRSMIFRYTKFHDEWSKESNMSDAERNMKNLIKDTVSYVGMESIVTDVVYGKFNLLFASKIRLMLEAGLTNNLYVRRGLRLLPDMKNIPTIFARFFRGYSDLSNKLRQQYPYIEDNGVRRLASRQEIDERVPGIVYDTMLSRIDTERVLLLIPFVRTGKTVWTLVDGTIPDELRKEVDVFNDIVSKLEAAVQWAGTSDFLNKMRELSKEVDIPEQAPSSTTSSTELGPIAKMYGVIANNLKFVTDKEKAYFTRISTKDIENSHDALFIKNVYARVIKRGNLPDTVQNVPKVVEPVTDDLQTKIEKILDAGEKGILDKTHFAFTIIPTVQQFGRVSDKQKHVLDRALAEIEKKTSKR